MNDNLLHPMYKSRNIIFSKFKHECVFVGNCDLRLLDSGNGNLKLQYSSKCKGCGNIKWFDVPIVSIDNEER